MGISSTDNEDQKPIESWRMVNCSCQTESCAEKRFLERKVSVAQEKFTAVPKKQKHSAFANWFRLPSFVEFKWGKVRVLRLEKINVKGKKICVCSITKSKNAVNRSKNKKFACCIATNKPRTSGSSISISSGVSSRASAGSRKSQKSTTSWGSSGSSRSSRNPSVTCESCKSNSALSKTSSQEGAMKNKRSKDTVVRINDNYSTYHIGISNKPSNAQTSIGDKVKYSSYNVNIDSPKSKKACKCTRDVEVLRREVNALYGTPEPAPSRPLAKMSSCTTCLGKKKKAPTPGKVISPQRSHSSMSNDLKGNNNNLNRKSTTRINTSTPSKTSITSKSSKRSLAAKKQAVRCRHVRRSFFGKPKKSTCRTKAKTRNDKSIRESESMKQFFATNETIQNCRCPITCKCLCSKFSFFEAPTDISINSSKQSITSTRISETKAIKSQNPSTSSKTSSESKQLASIRSSHSDTSVKTNVSTRSQTLSTSSSKTNVKKKSCWPGCAKKSAPEQKSTIYGKDTPKSTVKSVQGPQLQRKSAVKKEGKKKSPNKNTPAATSFPSSPKPSVVRIKETPNEQDAILNLTQKITMLCEKIENLERKKCACPPNESRGKTKVVSTFTSKMHPDTPFETIPKQQNKNDQVFLNDYREPTSLHGLKSGEALKIYHTIAQGKYKSKLEDSRTDARKATENIQYTVDTANHFVTDAFLAPSLQKKECDLKKFIQLRNSKIFSDFKRDDISKNISKESYPDKNKLLLNNKVCTPAGECGKVSRVLSPEMDHEPLRHRKDIQHIKSLLAQYSNLLDDTNQLESGSTEAVRTAYKSIQTIMENHKFTDATSSQSSNAVLTNIQTDDQIADTNIQEKKKVILRLRLRSKKHGKSFHTKAQRATTAVVGPNDVERELTVML